MVSPIDLNQPFSTADVHVWRTLYVRVVDRAWTKSILDGIKWFFKAV
jgi:hypothetical protein